MVLVVKAPKWKARLEAERRGIVWLEDDPHKPVTTSSVWESVIQCAEEYRDKVVAWFCEDNKCDEVKGYPVGTLLYHD